ncbi:hypothetical protein G9A89_006371 [Geosiphon pyriformis]|nr:hypothetical protein G9A89_006371 [Geosiphon pyriformis]
MSRTPNYTEKLKQCNWGDILITGEYSLLFQKPHFQPKFGAEFENHEEKSESESEKETSEKTITRLVTGTSSHKAFPLNFHPSHQEEKLLFLLQSIQKLKVSSSKIKHSKSFTLKELIMSKTSICLSILFASTLVLGDPREKTYYFGGNGNNNGRGFNGNNNDNNNLSSSNGNNNGNNNRVSWGLFKRCEEDKNSLGNDWDKRAFGGNGNNNGNGNIGSQNGKNNGNNNVGGGFKGNNNGNNNRPSYWELYKRSAKKASKKKFM